VNEARPAGTAEVPNGDASSEGACLLIGALPSGAGISFQHRLG
jgi:hypothetical protein